MLKAKIAGLSIVYIWYKIAAAVWFAIWILAGSTVQLNKFLPWKNEETVRDFIPNIMENMDELKNLPVHEIKAKDIMYSFNMTMGVLLHVNMNQGIKENTINPENGFAYLMKMTKTKNILPKPKLVSFSFDFKQNKKGVNEVSQCFNVVVKLITHHLNCYQIMFLSLTYLSKKSHVASLSLTVKNHE